VTDTSRDLGALSGPLAGAVFIGGLAAGIGIFTGCLALAGRRTGRLPEPLTAAGLAAAPAGVLSPLSLIIKPAVWLIPAGRLSGLAVTGAVGVLLSRPGRAGRESA
jgi:hypothetical protein